MSADTSTNEGTPFATCEPFPEPVDLGSVLDEITQAILRYLIVDRVQAEAAALWVVHTYLLDQSNCSPIALINAPERACAKTLFQTVLGRMVYRPLPISNITPSALFRSVERWRPTLLIESSCRE
jgi:putative DNA primase/helicase